MEGLGLRFNLFALLNSLLAMCWSFDVPLREVHESKIPRA